MNIFEPSTLSQNSAPCKQAMGFCVKLDPSIIETSILTTCVLNTTLSVFLAHKIQAGDYLQSWGAQNNVFCIFSVELHAEFSTHCKPAFVIQDKHKTLFFIVLTAAAAFEYKYKKRSD